jgi:hypothetical protein
VVQPTCAAVAACRGREGAEGEAEVGAGAGAGADVCPALSTSDAARVTAIAATLPPRLCSDSRENGASPACDGAPPKPPFVIGCFSLTRLTPLDLLCATP